MLQVTGLCKTFDTGNDQSVRAMRDVTFEVPRGKMFTLLGPSGCGKTTTLRSIAGLETPDKGSIEVSGKTVFSSYQRVNVAPARRGFGMVFQSYAIWPHMSVFRNVAFPLTVPSRRGQYSGGQVAEKVRHVLRAVALDGLEDRDATQLSGGQQQRLALARAIIMEPELLLLDEPLSNLDAKLRERMRFELKRLQQELGITTIYVTHDQGEALALSHQIAVMRDGAIVQVGNPREIYERPADHFVAEFIGSTNFLRGEVAGVDGALARTLIHTRFGPLSIPTRGTLAHGQAVTLSVRPEHVQIDKLHPESSDWWQGIISAQIFQGHTQEVEVRLGDTILQARVHPTVEFDDGEAVRVSVDPDHCIVCR